MAKCVGLSLAGSCGRVSREIQLAAPPKNLVIMRFLFMAAIGRFQKGDEIFYAKVVDGELFRLKGDVFGSPSFQKKATPLRGVKTCLLYTSPSPRDRG